MKKEGREEGGQEGKEKGSKEGVVGGKRENEERWKVEKRKGKAGWKAGKPQNSTKSEN